MAGHLGRDTSYRRLARQYYWDGMYRDVRQHTRSCTACQAHKQPRPDPRARPLRPLLPTCPNERLEIDLITDLPETKRGYRHILVMIDQVA
jgi:hypothetical protein